MKTMTATAAANYLTANLTGTRLFQLDFVANPGTRDAADKTASVRRTGDDCTITGLGAAIVVPADATFATLAMLCGSDKLVRRAVSQWSDLF
jgi:hypothetical protein